MVTSINRNGLFTSGRNCGRWLAALVGLAFAVSGSAASLCLAEAETIALDQDPILHAMSAQRAAMEERAVAAGQLPDPMVKAGFMSLPTDTWNL